MKWKDRILERSELKFSEKQKEPSNCLSAVDKLIADQEYKWDGLNKAKTKWLRCKSRKVLLGSFFVTLQYNPDRKKSVSTPVTRERLGKKECFLCFENMPSEEKGLALSDDFALFLNPYPIFYPHLVIIHREHKKQEIMPYLDFFLTAARCLSPGYSVIYNGPSCGASAPDHVHFQAIPRFSVPLEYDLYHLEHIPGMAKLKQIYVDLKDLRIFTLKDYGRSVLFLKSGNISKLKEAFLLFVDAVKRNLEPPLNLVCFFDMDEKKWVLSVFLRKRHRPHFYSTDEEGILVSPGAIDLAGTIITPRKKEYDSLDKKTVLEIYSDVCAEVDSFCPVEEIFKPLIPSGLESVMLLPGDVQCNDFSSEPEISVGIIENAKVVEFSLAGQWLINNIRVNDIHIRAFVDSGSIKMEWACPEIIKNERLDIVATVDNNSFLRLNDVTIGKGFHWEQKKEQTFEGHFVIFLDSEQNICVVNRIFLEKYLASVVASEMNPNAPGAFLKAHSVVARSWLLAQIAAKGRESYLGCSKIPVNSFSQVFWTDRDFHRLFDVCADDHCQRYQGIEGVIKNEAAVQAVSSTRGVVLKDDLGICDARFSKCCGGISEYFFTSWSDVHLPGLIPVRDLRKEKHFEKNLMIEKNAESWIMSSPASFCNIKDRMLLSNILKDFDLETEDFFRWSFEISLEELTGIVSENTGRTLGQIIDILPLERGASGRISRLLIVGSDINLLIAKELNIRKVLSKTHLYSSAFTVNKKKRNDKLYFVFHGAGWGHGVGMCQIGAAVMATRGVGWREIVLHYFPNTSLEKLYS